MGYVVKVPKPGLEMERGTVVAWLVDEGERVAEGDPIAKIESEKSTAEVEAREDGVLRRVVLDEGESGPPGAAMGIVAGPEEDVADLEAEIGGGAADASRAPGDEREPPGRDVAAHLRSDLSGTVAAGGYEWPYDVTPDFGGGDAPTPVDYFLGALSACLSASIGVQADVRDVEFGGIDVRAAGYPEEGSVEEIAIDVAIDVTDDVDDGTLDRIVANGERTCHVAELLREDLEVSIDWTRA